MSTTINYTVEQKAVIQLLKSAVPERSAEIDELWDKYGPAIVVAGDAPKIVMDANRSRIRFDNKTLRVIWLMGFNGWHSVSLYSPSIVLSQVWEISIDQALSEDDERGLLEMDYRSRASTAENLAHASSVELVAWPEDIPEPGANREQLTTDQHKSTFDLVCMATAFVLLHEFRHVMLDADEKRPEARLEEEAGCDVWARAFMMDKIDKYASQSGSSFVAIQQKRAMALALGAAILYDLTPEYDRFGSTDYPSLADRIHAMVTGTGPAQSSNFWLFASCLLIGIFRRTGQSLPFVVSDNETLVITLVEQLR